MKRIYSKLYKQILYLAMPLTLTALSLSPGLANALESHQKTTIKTMSRQTPIANLGGSGRAVLILHQGKGMNGVYITTISPSCALAQAGLKPGDIVLEIEGTKTSTTSQLDHLLNEAKGNSLSIKSARRNSQGLQFFNLITSEKTRKRSIGIPLKLVVPVPTRRLKRPETSSPPEYKKTEITELEAAMVDLVNQERTKLGLSPLKKSEALTKVARDHSLDMDNRKFFSHIDPDGHNPADRVKSANISYGFLAENICTEKYAESDLDLVKRSHQSLMKSPHHRENILNTQIKSVGVGIYHNKEGGISVTQLFANPIIP